MYICKYVHIIMYYMGSLTPDDCIDVISTMYCYSKVRAGPALFITVVTDDVSIVCVRLNVTNKCVYMSTPLYCFNFSVGL